MGNRPWIALSTSLVLTTILAAVLVVGAIRHNLDGNILTTVLIVGVGSAWVSFVVTRCHDKRAAAGVAEADRRVQHLKAVAGDSP